MAIKTKANRSPRKKKVKQEGEIDWSKFYGYRCHFSDVIKQSAFVMSKFDEYTVNVLKKTPFYPFFWAINEGNITEKMVEKCSKSICQILKMYRHDLRGFVLNPTQQEAIKLSPRITSLVFGISMSGLHLNDADNEFFEVCDIYNKFFKGKKSVARKEIREAIEDLQREKNLSNDDKVQLVKLLILYSMSALFFGSTSGIVSKGLMRNFDSIKSLNEVCWPKEITQRLVEQVVNYRSKPMSVSGCVYLLLYMLVEHANVIQPLVCEAGQFPRMLKWDLSKVTSDNWIVIQKKLIEAEVKVEIDQISDVELKIIEGEQPLSPVEESDEEIKSLDGTTKEQRTKENPLHELHDAAMKDQSEEQDEVQHKLQEENVELTETEQGRKADKKTTDKKKSKVEKKEKKVEKKDSEKSVVKKKTKEKKIHKDVEEDVGDKIVEKVEKDKDKEVETHLMSVFPNDPLNDVLEDYYGIDFYMENLTDDAANLKHLLRREKTIREKLTLKCNFLEKLLKARDVDEGEDENQKLKKELDLLEETYIEALKLFHAESVRSDFSLASLVDKNDKMEKMHNQVVEELKKEMLDQKRYLNDAEARIDDQAKTIKSCRERELKLMKEVSYLKKKIEVQGQEFQKKGVVLQEKINMLERVKGEADKVKSVVESGSGDNTHSERIEELEKVNNKLEKQVVENLDMYLQLKEDSEKTSASKNKKILTLMTDKERILERLKKVAYVAVENKMLKKTVENLEMQIKANDKEPLMATPIIAVQPEMGSEDQSEEKKKMSGRKTKDKTLEESEVDKTADEPTKPKGPKIKRAMTNDESTEEVEEAGQVLDLDTNEKGKTTTSK